MKAGFFPVAGMAAVLAFLFIWSGSAQQAPDPLARARTLAESGKLADAETLLHSLLQANAASADAHFLLGYVYFREKKPRESLTEFTAGARTRRPAAEEFQVIASDYVLLGDYTDATRWFLEVTAEKPNDAEAWYLLGRTQYNDGHFANAMASFEHALNLRAHYVEAENNLGLACEAQDNLQAALAAYQTAVEWELDHPTDPQPYLNLGSLLTQENRPKEALPNLKAAAALAPGNPKIHEELARAYEALNDLHEAQHELEQAIALAPNASGLHFKLGRIYRREGLLDRSRQEFAVCARLDSTHSSISTPNPYSPD